jgi:hypothetical protein
MVAVLVAAVVVYDVGVAPPSLAKKDHAEAQGEIEILIDSNRSPIADVGRDLEPLTARAGVFARYIAGGNVIKRIAQTTGIPAKEIEVAGPTPLPGEAIGVPTGPLKLQPYGIEIAQRDELPIVNVSTRAPTVREAQALAAATPDAIRVIVGAIQEKQRIPVKKRVTFRVLGPAQADLATEALGAKAAIGIFLLVFGLGLLLILGLPRLVEAWRSVEMDPSGQEPVDVPHIQPALPEEMASPPTLAPAEAIAERAQLRRGDG